jgi:hypothetical protein
MIATDIATTGPSHNLFTAAMMDWNMPWYTDKRDLPIRDLALYTHWSYKTKRFWEILENGQS